eukprot:557109-Prorocentrum_lima.AAC.1
MTSSLVGSEMCIRDRTGTGSAPRPSWSRAWGCTRATGLARSSWTSCAPATSERLRTGKAAAR